MTSLSEFSTFNESQTRGQPSCDRVDEASTQRCFEDCNRVKPLATEDQRLKVYLRVRPFLKEELANNESQDCVIIKDSETVVLAAPKHSNTLKNSERGIGQAVHKFTFSQIFGQDTSQTEFFNGTVEDLVKQYLQGQNGLVFTYGVTNAGKTYTIQGTSKDGGILPRSLDMLFDHIKGRQYQSMDLKPYVSDEVLKLDSNQTQQEEAMKFAIFSSPRQEMECQPFRTTSNKSVQKDLAQASSITQADCVPFNQLEKHSEVITAASDMSLTDQKQRRYSVWVSFCEIYNEYVYDLLDPIPTLRSQKRQNLRICEDQKGNSYVKDLKWINITSSDEAFKALKIGNKNRSSASTKMNHRSSRSHSIFSIRLMEVIVGDKSRVIRTSDLYLCDLAGSERSGKAQTFGDRLKEAGNINNSLLILGKCISALRQKQQNKLKQIIVPFRESKLTRLFQAFFCGKGKACMIININQCASMYDETLHVMKFSAVAKQIIQIIHPKIKLQLADQVGGNDGSMMVCTDLGESLSAENCYSEDLIKNEEEQENGDLDLTTFAHKELLSTIESLRHKLIAERQNKLVLEMRVRKEMGEAMFQQLLRTEEIWSERFEELKEIYEDQLDSNLHMYKESIRRHAYKCAMEEVKDKFVLKEEFTAEQHKAKAADLKVKELEVALSKCQNQPAAAESTTGLLEELAWFREEASKMHFQLQYLQLEALANGKELRRYQELYKSKVLSEEQSAKLLEEKDQVNKTLTRELKDICSVLQEEERKFQESNEELQKCNDTIAKQEKMFKDVNEEHVDKIHHLQNVVSKLQEELALSTKLSKTEKPPHMKKKLFLNLTGSKLAVGCPSKASLFKSRELTPRLTVKKNAVSGKRPSLPSNANK
ncbi:kinesin-like protein KIF20A isoform X2 [Pristis pectinata]|uniref:kinesin-like protein KIF20A isoform X2 n=1 Tax=Pristis pectinata TaxID=685728 RepID=UPI00223CBEB1|nr:kinesin-like protein KIF20A isoform X2 [Pristis pectinata]XP_051879396.1 kinesin-like protein KIF20A isoform X2 [Pristis pectinata]